MTEIQKEMPFETENERKKLGPPAIEPAENTSNIRAEGIETTIKNTEEKILQEVNNFLLNADKKTLIVVVSQHIGKASGLTLPRLKTP